MNWSNVRLIFYREVRDQLRDRRTMFMIAVLPLLLYPLLGMSFFQIAQFMREHPSQALVLGDWNAPGVPPLVQEDSFAQELFSDPSRAKLVKLGFEDETDVVPVGSTVAEADRLRAQWARELVKSGQYEVVVLFPHDFSQSLEEFRERMRERPGEAASSIEEAALEVPKPTIIHNTAKEKSQIAETRVSDVLRRWRETIVQKSLKDSQLPLTAAKPFEFAQDDVADKGHRDAAVWSKILPFILLIWALTGAFYPAIDLCAGEKERGTLETLLSSPAERSEIVSGKLLTIMLFSIATSILNLASMGITGSFVVKQLGSMNPATAGVGLPSTLSIVWLLIALVPTSALFSALCLALAAFARSSKEGQYYLMPLLLVTMPLMMLPMAPGVEMTLGNSFIPVTGVVLLLRMLLEGNYAQAMLYVVPVTVVTGGCCLLAMRWAVEQFNTESVLFRESERLDVGLWLKHLMVDRGETPSVAEGAFCALLILIVMFFMSFALPQPKSFGDVANLIAITQLAIIATPALLMTVMLTRSPAKTLSLRIPPLCAIPAAVVLSVTLHPLLKLVQMKVQELYPMNPELFSGVSEIIKDVKLPYLLLLIAVLPAICEELAFRGFVLSGLRRSGHKWRPIIISSLFFGFTHSVFQQSLIASGVGLVIGYLVVQSGSIFTGMAFHVTNNSIVLLVSKLFEREDLNLFERGDLGWLYYTNGEKDFGYQWYIVLLGVAISAGILSWFRSLSGRQQKEQHSQLRSQPVVAGRQLAG